MQTLKELCGLKLLKEYVIYYQKQNKEDKGKRAVPIFLGYISLVYGEIFGQKKDFSNAAQISNLWLKISSIDDNIDVPDQNMNRTKILDDFFEENFKDTAQKGYESAFNLKEAAKREFSCKNMSEFLSVSVDVGKYGAQFTHDRMNKEDIKNPEKFRRLMDNLGIAAKLIDNIIDYKKDFYSFNFGKNGTKKYLLKCFLKLLQYSIPSLRNIPITKRFNFVIKHFPLFLYFGGKLGKGESAKYFFDKVKFKY